MCKCKWHRFFGDGRLSAMGIDDVIWFPPLEELTPWWRKQWHQYVGEKPEREVRLSLEVSS